MSGNGYELICADVIEGLRTLPTESVHATICSPPYWGLRSYGTDNQIGLEPTIDLYIEHMVAVFREVRRVLRKDGTVFMNLGDSYFSGSGRVRGYDNGDKAQQGSTCCAQSCRNPYDARTDVWWNHIEHNGIRHALQQADESLAQILENMDDMRGHLPILDSSPLIQIRQSCVAILDQVHFGHHALAQLHTLLESTQLESYLQRQVGYLQSHSFSACLSSLQTFAACVQRFSRMLGDASEMQHYTADIASLSEELAHHIECTSACCSLLFSWLNSPYSEPECTTIAPIGQGLKPKDLCGIPWRVALALQADGWWLRSDIIYSKPNAMPGSQTDRPTTSHEYMFLLTKSGKPTYWTHRDHAGTRKRPKADYRWIDRGMGDETAERPEDVKEMMPCPECDGTGKATVSYEAWGQTISDRSDGPCNACGGGKKVPRWKRVNLWRGHDYFYDADAVREVAAYEGDQRGLRADSRRGTECNSMNGTEPTHGRNLRSVWTIPTQPYKGAHFATFPEKLVEPCIRAGSSAYGCCPDCGAPWERVVEKCGEYDDGFRNSERYVDQGPGAHSDGKAVNNSLVDWKRSCGAGKDGEYHGKATKDYESARAENPSEVKARILKGMAERHTVAWRPTCECGREDVVPCTILDPFVGSGTTIVVALQEGRSGIGIDNNAEYLELARKRIAPIYKAPRLELL